MAAETAEAAEVTEEAKELTVADKFKLAMVTLLPTASLLAMRPDMSPDRIMRILFAAAVSNNDIYYCDPMSVARAVMKATELGLEAGGALEEAYLVPYKNEIKLVISYHGYLKLIHNAGECISVNVQNVYEKDTFELDLASSHIRHSPYLLGDRGGILFSYARTKNQAGEYSMTIMTRDEIEAIRKASAARNRVWEGHYGEMARKTVLRRHVKYQLKSTELRKALSVDKELVDDVSELKVQVTRAQRFLDRLNQADPPPPKESVIEVGTEYELPVGANE